MNLIANDKRIELSEKANIHHEESKFKHIRQASHSKSTGEL